MNWHVKCFIFFTAFTQKILNKGHCLGLCLRDYRFRPIKSSDVTVTDRLDRGNVCMMDKEIVLNGQACFSSKDDNYNLILLRGKV